MEARDFAQTVFPGEINEIQKRRALVGQEPVPVLVGGAPEPSTNLKLTGVALSGGGIRSAAFCLGVIQALADRGVFARMDYLSTVSGGGYLGAALSHLLNGRGEEQKTTPDAFPLRMGSGTVEPPALQHLRNSSNYLKAGGAFDSLAMPAVYARGLALTIVSWSPLLLGSVLAASILYEVVFPKLEAWGYVVATGPNLWPAKLFGGLFGCLIAAYPFARRPGSALVRREQLEWAIRVTLGMTLASLAILPVWWLVDYAVLHTQAQAAREVAGVHADVLSFVRVHAWGVGLGAVVAAGLGWTRPGRILGRSLGMLLLGSLAPAGALALFLLLCVTQIGGVDEIPNGRDPDGQLFAFRDPSGERLLNPHLMAALKTSGLFEDSIGEVEVEEISGWIYDEAHGYNWNLYAGEGKKKTVSGSPDRRRPRSESAVSGRLRRSRGRHPGGGHAGDLADQCPPPQRQPDLSPWLLPGPSQPGFPGRRGWLEEPWGCLEALGDGRRGRS